MKLLVGLVILLPVLAFAGEQGTLGIGVDVSVDGVFFPKLREAKVKHVEAGSSASEKNVKVGHRIVSIDGCDIPGCPARKAKKGMSKMTGESVTLELVDLEGKNYKVTLIAR